MIRFAPIARPSDLPGVKPLALPEPAPASPPPGPAELPLARGRERSARRRAPGHGLSCRAPGRCVPRLSASRTAGPARARASSGPAEPSRGTPGAPLSPDPAAPAVRVPRRSLPRRPRTPGAAAGGALAMLFALAAVTLAFPSTAQAQPGNATGEPAITGTATVGQTLTVTQGTIADPNGLHTGWFSNATTTVQWIRVDSGTDSDISSATGRTYTLVDDDLGKQIKVKVDFTDAAGAGSAESRTSAAFPSGGTVGAPDTTAPRLNSIAAQDPLSVLDSVPTNADTLTWRVTFSEAVSNLDATDFILAGPTNAMLAVQAVAGMTGVYDVTASGGDLASLNGYVFLEVLRANNIQDLAGNALANIVPDGASATYIVDNTAPTLEITDVPLTSSAPFTGTFDFSEAVMGFEVGDITLGNAVAASFMSASSSLYTAQITPTADGTVTVDVLANSAQDLAGNDNTAATRVSSTYTTAANTAPTGAPTITGTAQVGQTLTAVTTAIMDTDGLTTPGYTYQWIRVATDSTETDIATATASTYTLVTDDLGTTIKVKVSFTDDASNAETLTSVATAAVTAATTGPTEVPNNWSLKPTGLAAGDQFRLLFLSSTKRNATATDIATYNTFIQTLAAAGHTDIRTYSAGFRAVGCTADTDARDNTSTTYISTAKGVPIYWLNGTKAADEYEDFYDGSWDDAANDKNESGADAHDTSQSANYPFTGCANDGTEVFGGGGTRSRALGNSVVKVGDPNGGVPIGSTRTLVASTATRPLYGLSALFQVATAVVNNPPAFSSSTAARSVAENTAAAQNVGAALTATDLDGHTLTYTLEGTDAASFGILSASGQIQTKAGVTYNHEAQSTYTVIVKADDSNGGTDTVTVTITVTDVAEPPGRPAVPLVTATAGSSTGLDVTWTAPTNTGPAITSYDLQYREGTSGSFTAGPQNETGTSAAIASLMASTSHQVQVRATNAEGDGDWSFSGTGRTGNTAPEFSANTAARSVAENTAAGQNVGAVLTATDADSDTLAYTLEGTDAASFGILSTSGQIQTKAGVTYNHEAQSTYTVIVKADDSNGGTDTVTVTITVTDVAEPPGRPAAPLVTATAGSSTGLDVAWTAPTNTGPAITSYDLQYREGSSGSFTAGPQNETGTSAAIASLMASTSHQVQVRATNAEGDGDWSFSGTGRTGNTAPEFSANTAARSVAENTAAGQNVGAVLTATDADSDTLAYTLEGTDAASFGILSTSGQIQTKAGVTYNHEAQSTYTVIVKADDSNGGTDTVTVTITVTDVAEPPGRPAAPLVTATAGSSTGLDVTWTAPTNTGPAITSYDLQYREGTSGSFTAGPQNETGTSAAIASLMASTSHQVQVRATNAEGDGDWSFSGTGRTASANTPAMGAPTITGTPQVGQTLTAATTAITDVDGLTGVSYTYQWIRVDGGVETNIATATANTYTLVTDDQGKTIKVKVSFTDDANNAETLTSVATAAVAAAPNTAATGAPTISGTPQVGQTLRAATTAIRDANGLNNVSYTYQWIRVDGGVETNIATATASAYTLVTDDQGKTIKVKVSFTDDANNAETLTSVATAAVSAASNTLATGAPTITGTAQVGQTLTADTTAIMDANGLNNVSYTYQWIRVDGGTETNISMATANTYTLMTDDQGKTIRVKVSFTDDASNPETLTSVATATVSAAAATAPGAPTGLSATANGATRIDLAWTAPASSGGSPISGYRIESSPDGTSSWSDLEANTNNTNTTYAHTGLAGGTTRHYRVSAINDTGPGRASNVDSATTSQTDQTGQTTVTFEASLYTAVEGGAAATVTVQLTPAPSAPVTIPLVVTHMGTTTAADYSPIPPDVTFTTGQTTVTFTVTATVDPNDGGESVSIRFGSLPAGVELGARDTAVVTLSDGSEQAFIVSFSTSSSTTVEVREGPVGRRLSVFLRHGYLPQNADPPQPVTIPLVVTYEGGASAADHTAIPAIVTVAAHEHEASYEILAIQDQINETDEGLKIDFGTLPPGVSKSDWGPYETIAFVDGLVPSRATVDGTTLVLTFTTDLNSASAPFPSDFTVTVDNTRVDVDQVSVSGSMVTLTLATAVQVGQAVTLDYRQGDNRIRDVDGNAAMSFAGWVVATGADGGATGGETTGGETTGGETTGGETTGGGGTTGGGTTGGETTGGGGSTSGGTTGGGSTGGGGGGGGAANRPPVVERQIPDQTITVGEVLELDITLNFYDRDQRTLDYSVESADAAVATVAVDPQGVLTIQGVARGVTSVTLTAADRRDERASQSFTVTVRCPTDASLPCPTAQVPVLGPTLMPFFPSASDSLGRQGFLRIINRSEGTAEVFVEAIDDRGSSAGTVSLTIDDNAVAHFNSIDLEEGNPGKGLSAGLGSGAGDWRLFLDSDQEFEALAYIRTEDGFLTSMHEVVPVSDGVHRVAVFNPGSNPNQVSHLRLVNPGTDDAEVTISGIDDAGASPGTEIEVEVPARQSVTVSASDLESGAGVDGALGDGTGKWRLRVASEVPIVAMSLLSSPTGHLTNLSTVPGAPGEDGAHVVPLFPSASDPLGRQGFVRVVNTADVAGEVRIEAYNDTDTVYEAVTLALGAGQTVHFNSDDLELGNSGKGLTGSTGPGVGDWRLVLSSALEIDVLAYIRTSDGFLTSMHDVVPSVDGKHWVAIFNPGSNPNQVSRLRLVNPGAEDAEVTITGIDDAGESAGGSVTVTVPSGASRTIEAADLEAGAEGVEGALGDGAGKWRLAVTSEQPIIVMSLLSSPTGHLTNLSTAPEEGRL